MLQISTLDDLWWYAALRTKCHCFLLGHRYIIFGERLGRQCPEKKYFCWKHIVICYCSYSVYTKLTMCTWGSPPADIWGFLSLFILSIFISIFYFTVTFLHWHLRVPTTFYSTNFYSASCHSTFYSAVTILHLKCPITFCSANFYSVVTFLHLHLKVSTTWGPHHFFIPLIFISLWLFCTDTWGSSPHFMPLLYFTLLFWCDLFALTTVCVSHQ